MEDEKRKKKKKMTAAVILLIIATACYSAFSSGSDDEIESAVVSAAKEEAESPEEESVEEEGLKEDAEAEEIFVDVGGSVKEPRVVCIPKGSRVFEAIEAAGGVTENAETKYLNMAEECTDGEKIYVPDLQEISEAESDGAGSELFSSEFESAQTGASSESEGKININTATSEELQTLDGIGPAMASRIIEYRQANGSFESVDDLTNVSGIGEKTLQKLEPNVCV